MLRSKGESIPEAVPPVLDTYEEHNFEYRGPEDHGVPVYNEVEEPEDFLDDTIAGPDHPDYVEHKPEPTEVVVVEGTRRVLARMHTSQVTVTSVPVQILGQNDNRLRVLIKVLTTTDSGYVYVSNEQMSCNGMSGYYLSVGDELELKNDSAVYIAHSDTAADAFASVCFIEEINVFVDSE